MPQTLRRQFRSLFHPSDHWSTGRHLNSSRYPRNLVLFRFSSVGLRFAFALDALLFFDGGGGGGDALVFGVDVLVAGVLLDGVVGGDGAAAGLGFSFVVVAEFDFLEVAGAAGSVGAVVLAAGAFVVGFAGGVGVGGGVVVAVGVGVVLGGVVGEEEGVDGQEAAQVGIVLAGAEVGEAGGVGGAAEEAAVAGPVGGAAVVAGVAEGELFAAGDGLAGAPGDGDQCGALAVAEEEVDAGAVADGDGLAGVGVVAGGGLRAGTGGLQFVAAGEVGGGGAVGFFGEEAVAGGVVEVFGGLAVLGEGGEPALRAPGELLVPGVAGA